ncbi:chemotaxis-specific protein-glutamate methyltransferase CheB [Oscillatoria sp. FACHB-1407]|uniref:chemotaxis-specific protein-glutamate methyltransferase CheB n=1 Tax=Oscillatoria sp. FACHB-1407 TaxID=2692847 RepID=UPI0016831BFE|nr:chemotaxis-specific protein-glutamate methyltransferase CheB [Oscillatoria sp. FACHB-1407]MBD2459513.1 chemotaxis-specific protein-glutamate methyltransferase CheB [Oscillatoria sp. FACHB-1407]
MPASPIAVLLVEDSPVALMILKRILAGSSEIEVVGVAQNGIEALEMIPKLQPKVICTDLNMPKMSGLELTRRVMAECPRPILVISASVDQQDDAQNVFQLLQAGALDVFPKPTVELLSEYEQIKHELITKIKIIAGVSVFTQHPGMRNKELVIKNSKRPENEELNPHQVNPYTFSNVRSTLPRVIAIGASTGGPQALFTILKSLPANFPIPILCVQHISVGFLDGLVGWLSTECQLRIVIARAGDVPQPGIVYFAPDHYHLQLDQQGRIALSSDVPVSGHRPSISMTFQAVANYYRQASLGILLTGMGRDGAEGLLAIARAGGTTIAQDEQSCIVFGMPKEAIALGAAQQILPIGEIAPKLLKQCLRQ